MAVEARLSSSADYTITLDSKVHFSEKEGSIVSSLPGPSGGDFLSEPILSDARLSWIVRQSNPDVPHEQLAAQLETSDASRRTGDVTIYKYYLEMVGILNSVVFFIAVAIFTFSLAFPSECRNPLYLIKAHRCRCMGPMVGCRKRKAPIQGPRHVFGCICFPGSYGGAVVILRMLISLYAVSTKGDG